MTRIHQLVLYGLLVFLGVSLFVPGLLTLFEPELGSAELLAQTLDARHHLRALNGMLSGIGLMALWACWDLARARRLVRGLGLLLAWLVLARLYSLWVDGLPGGMKLIYLGVETLMALVFLLWPPQEQPY